MTDLPNFSTPQATVTANQGQNGNSVGVMGLGDKGENAFDMLSVMEDME